MSSSDSEYVPGTGTTRDNLESPHAESDGDDPESFNSPLSADESSVSLSKSPRGRSRSRKRKESTDQYIDDLSSRRKRHYSSKYHSLLNHTIDDLQFDPLWQGRSDLYPSQIGISRWSPQEKEFFYRGLVRYGRTDLPAIAALIGTKSELEVHVYLQLLQENNVKLHMYGDRQSLISTADIPAAVEVSEQCCAALEQAAESLAQLQQRYEERHEKQKHADLWRLDDKAAHWIDQCISEGEEGIAQVRQRVPAAEILNLGTFLELSAKLFMNSSEPDGNYRSFVSRCEKPSIQYTAFSDLYSVALSITKRIIQSSLFFAMSRRRATQSSSYSHKRAVKRADVVAVLNVLGLKENARDFWIELPRRCNLDVHDSSSKTGYGGAMHHEEVERILGWAPITEALVADESEDEAYLSKSNAASSLDPEEVSTMPSSPNTAASRDHSPSRSSAASDSPPPAKDFDHRTEEYLEYIDRQASAKEELKLWEMLGKEPPSDLLVGEPTSGPKPPGPHRQSKDELDDWRGWTDFRPVWEAYDLGGLDKDLVENEMQMQRLSTKLAKSRGRGHHTHPPGERATSRTSQSDDELGTSERDVGDECEDLERSEENEDESMESHKETSSDEDGSAVRVTPG
ncbi:MAG: hypothetical protein L6R39_006483 [Caloplaca ligustica]|nr:MAG: hypothetical protein L6R39_006483 [Caloplaca ligustica]